MRAEPMSMTGACAPGGTPAGGHAETPAISLRGVSRRFGTLLAVDGVDLDVRRGEVFGLIGHNGAGKSTLFKMMLGLLPASGGSIRVAGADVSGRDARAVRRQVGYLPENVVLWDNLTGLETLRFFARVKAVPVDTCPALLARVGLEAAMRRPVREYSKGMRQRLGFAQALLGQPQVLFLDEPTTGLDPQGRRRVWERVEAFKAEGGAVLLTTHHMEEAERLADELAIVDHGRVIARGSPQAIIRSLGAESVIECAPAGGDPRILAEAELLALAGVTAVRYEKNVAVLSVTRTQDALAGLFALAARRGLALDDLRTHRPTLEDVFVTLTGKHLRDE